MPDIDRWPHNANAALAPHSHVCPECGTTYTCACSEHDRHEKLVCYDCEKKG